jgi:hypothetical protein
VLSYIWERVNFFKITHKVEQLFILNLSSESGYGHTIVKIEGEGNDRVVNKNDILQLSVLYDP